jgi:hypothetical protein
VASVMERLIMQEVDYKTPALLLYALQTASMNLKRTSLEPELPTRVVIDREYDDLGGDDPNEESDRKQPPDSERLQ